MGFSSSLIKNLNISKHCSFLVNCKYYFIWCLEFHFSFHDKIHFFSWISFFINSFFCLKFESSKIGKTWISKVSINFLEKLNVFDDISMIVINYFLSQTCWQFLKPLDNFIGKLLWTKLLIALVILNESFHSHLQIFWKLSLSGKIFDSF